MADNFLEKHRAAYEERKAEWLRKKKCLPKYKKGLMITKPEDESL